MIYFSIFLLSFIIGVIITIGLSIKNRYDKNYADIIIKRMETPNVTKKTILIIMLILIPIEVYLLSNLPEHFFKYVMLSAGLLLLSFTGYIYTYSKTGLLLGPVFIFLYTYYWNIFTFNMVAMIWAVGVILFLDIYLKWDNIKQITILFLIVDFVLVYVTKDMIDVAQKVMLYELPNMIIIPDGLLSAGLGLGDISLAGLLCLKISEEKKYNIRKTQIFTWTLCLFTYPLFLLMKLYFPGGAPATFMIVSAFIFSYLAVNAPEYIRKIGCLK